MALHIRKGAIGHPVATFLVVAYALSGRRGLPLIFAEWWATWSPLVLAGDIQTILTDFSLPNR